MSDSEAKRIALIVLSRTFVDSTAEEIISVICDILKEEGHA